jgi:hypothetical protein
MRRLELSPEEVRQLPDNLKLACAQGRFPPDFDPVSPDAPFLPPDLLEADGPWVPFTAAKVRIGAQFHAQSTGYRNLFVPLIRVSPQREDTLAYLDRLYNGELAAPPDGTILALIRRTVLPLSSGNMATTTITESLQLIVVDAPRDHRYKYSLDRFGLLSGRSGLRAVSMDEPVDAYSFESGGLHPHFPSYDLDGELLAFGRWAGPASRGTPALSHCADCHGQTVGQRLFANTGRSGGPAKSTTWDEQAKLVLTIKEESAGWRMYRGLRD